MYRARDGEHFEGPHWSTSENALYWVDITMQRVHRLDTTTENVTTREIGKNNMTIMILPLERFFDYKKCYENFVCITEIIIYWNSLRLRARLAGGIGERQS